MKWLIGLLALLTVAAAEPAPRPSASDPVEKQDPTGEFLRMHEAFLARDRAGPIGLLFLGDSITARWRLAPDVWARFYGRYEPANFGIAGDTTQNVIWRIEHGELDGIRPRVVVLMLGTNDTGVYTGAEIAAADGKIVGLIRRKIPGVRILLLGIFPRGPRPDAAGRITPRAVAEAAGRMAEIRAANAALARLDDGRSVRYLDLGAVFLGPDGRIPLAIMPDQLHPTPAGYERWARAMQPLLDRMLAGS